MKLLAKAFSTLILSVALFIGFLFANQMTPDGLAAIAPQEAYDIIQESGSVKEAGERLKAGDSFDNVRDHKALDTAKEIRERNHQQARETSQRDELIDTAQNKIQDAVENVKEKLNLDEPLAPSTKEFLGKREETIKPNGDVIVREKPGYYQRDRHTQTFVEKGRARDYHQEAR